MPRTKKAGKIRPPRQERSRATLERILNAAESLLESSNFEDTSLNQIADRAGVTIGAIYARFPSKDALLECLEQRLEEDLSRDSDQLFDELAPEVPLAEQIETLVGTTVRWYRGRRGLIRALVQSSRINPVVRKRRERFNKRFIEKVLTKMSANRREIDHSNPRLALELSLLAFVSTLRELILFNEFWPGKKPPSDTRLVRELAGMCVSYLGINEP